MSHFPTAVTDEEVTLSLHGPVTIAQARDLREAILRAIPMAPVLRLDCSQVTKVDLSFLQILQATHRQIQQLQKTLKVLDPDLPPCLRRAIFQGGFEEKKVDPSFPVCPFFQTRHLGEETP